MRIETMRGPNDVHTKDWTKQPFFNATRVWMKLLCACKELTIIGTESHRLMTSMKSEEEHLNVMINPLKNENPELVNYVTLNFQYRQNIHEHLQTKLAKLMTWPPYNSKEPQSTIENNTTKSMSLDQRSQDESLGTYGDGNKDGAEHKGGEDRETDRNLAIDWLVEVLADLNVE